MIGAVDVELGRRRRDHRGVARCGWRTPLEGTVTEVDGTHERRRYGPVEVGGARAPSRHDGDTLWVAHHGHGRGAAAVRRRRDHAAARLGLWSGRVRRRRAPRPPRRIGSAAARRNPRLTATQMAQAISVRPCGGGDSAPVASASAISHATTRWRGTGLFDEARCAANARAVCRERRRGRRSSVRSTHRAPSRACRILNRAPDGAWSQWSRRSPGIAGLTHAWPGRSARELAVAVSDRDAATTCACSRGRHASVRRWRCFARIR